MVFPYSMNFFYYIKSVVSVFWSNDVFVDPVEYKNVFDGGQKGVGFFIVDHLLGFFVEIVLISDWDASNDEGVGFDRGGQVRAPVSVAF